MECPQNPLNCNGPHLRPWSVYWSCIKDVPGSRGWRIMKNPINSEMNPEKPHQNAAPRPWVWKMSSTTLGFHALKTSRIRDILQAAMRTCVSAPRTIHASGAETHCPWVDLAEIEEGHDKETLQAAMTTWRFCATGVDGLEETSLMREVFAPETLPPSHPRLWRRSAVLSWLPSGSPCRGAPLSHQYPPKDT